MKNNNPNLRLIVREINKRDDAKSQKIEEKFEKKIAKKKEKFLKKFEEKIVKHIVAKRSYMHFNKPYFLDTNDILFSLMKSDRLRGIGFSITYQELTCLYVIRWYITEGV